MLDLVVLTRSISYYDFQPVADRNALNFVEADLITAITENRMGVGTEESGYQCYSYPA